MTFFLDQHEERPKIRVSAPTFDLPEGLFDGLMAGFSAAASENDANFRHSRELLKERQSRTWFAAERIGADAIVERAKRNGVSPKIADAFAATMKLRGSLPRNAMVFPQMEGVIKELARERAIDNPDAWSDLDLSDEVIARVVGDRLEREHEQAEAVLDMMPTGSGFSRFFGGMVGATLDIKNLPFLLMGGGSGSIMRVVGREALINMAAEAAFMPAQFRMADVLEIPDPNVAEQLAIAAAAGGALGGLMEAGARGVTYFKMRDRAPDIPGYDPITVQGAVDQTEDILTSDTPRPFDQIRQLQEEVDQAPYRLENPTNPARPPLIPDDVARPGDTVPPSVETTPLDPVDGGPREPLPDNALIENLRTAVEDAKAADNVAGRPLAQYLKDSAKEGEGTLKIDPDGEFGQELKAQGITSQTMPGLFSKRGRRDFDNLPADEWEKDFPGIIDATGTEYGATYLDRQGFLDLVRRDLEGDASWLRTRADVQAREADLENALREADGSPAEDFVAGERAEGGFYVDLNEYEFLHGNLAGSRIASDLDTYLEKNGLTFLTDEEKAEILNELQTRGGDAQYLVERAGEREIDHGARLEQEAPDDIPFGDDATTAPRDVGQGAEGAGQPEGATGGQGGGAARTDDAGTPRTEQTAAGEQVVVPGIEPVTQRQRLEAQQAAPMRGGDAAADEGLFDTGARAQIDMFDDPTAPEARVVQDSIISDVRSDIEASGPTEMPVTLEDGTTLKTDQDILDYLDEGDKFSARIDLCGKGGAA